MSAVELDTFLQFADRFTPYLCSLLRRRRLPWWLVEEALASACQFLALAWLEEGSPADWPAGQRLLDGAVYRAAKEVRPLAGPLPPEDLLLDRRRDSEQLPAWWLALEQLPAEQRLLWRLKQAAYYYPQLPERVTWDSDEAQILAKVHPGREPEDITREFLSRLRQYGRQDWRTVPAAVIAWLLGRASTDAVNQAYSKLLRQLREQLAAAG